MSTAQRVIGPVVRRTWSGVWMGICVGVILGVALAAVAVRGHSETKVPQKLTPSAVTVTTIGGR